MTFPERVVYHKAIQMYTTVCGDAPDYLKNVSVFTSEIHSRLLRSSSNFQLYTPNYTQNYFVTRSFFQALQNGILFLSSLKLHLLWNISNLYIWDGINNLRKT